MVDTGAGELGGEKFGVMGVGGVGGFFGGGIGGLYEQGVVVILKFEWVESKSALARATALPMHSSSFGICDWDSMLGC